MDLAYFLSLLLFTATMTITPGPNNIMLAASGFNFGYIRTIPHVLGIAFGFVTLCLAVAFGLGAVFQQFPVVHTSLKVLGSAYLLWLAWKIATAEPASEHTSTGKPFTFWQAAIFQYVNPKAWTMAITGISAFTLQGDLLIPSALAVVVAFGLVEYPCCSFWAVLGTQVRRFLSSPKNLRRFNQGLGVLTAGCVVFILSS